LTGVEKVFLLSLRAQRSNLAVKQINKFEIAASQKTLLAMTLPTFFNSLLSLYRVHPWLYTII
jgi:hypothetical protein